VPGQAVEIELCQKARFGSFCRRGGLKA